MLACGSEFCTGNSQHFLGFIEMQLNSLVIVLDIKKGMNWHIHGHTLLRDRRLKTYSPPHFQRLITFYSTQNYNIQYYFHTSCLVLLYRIVYQSFMENGISRLCCMICLKLYKAGIKAPKIFVISVIQEKMFYLMLKLYIVFELRKL